MAITAASAASTTQVGNSKTGSVVNANEQSKQSLAKTFDSFLLMLTTQLKNQDPLAPMDSTQFTNQLVQFAGVEQQINVNSNLTQLLDLQKANRVASAVSYIGKGISVPGYKLPLQDGKAAFSYNMPTAANKAEVAIADKDGNVVYTKVVDASKGIHEVRWDGKNSAGTQLADGAYTVSIRALDPETGKDMTGIKTFVSGTVTGVTTSPKGGLLLAIGDDLDVNLDDVLEFRQAI